MATVLEQQQPHESTQDEFLTAYCMLLLPTSKMQPTNQAMAKHLSLLGSTIQFRVEYVDGDTQVSGQFITTKQCQTQHLEANGVHYGVESTK